MIECPKCKQPECCITIPMNETKNEYGCLACGFFTSDLMIEEDFDFATFEETIPELYKDVKHKDDQGRVWYPNIVNIPDTGIVFLSGTSKEDWQWASIKSVPLTKKEAKSPRFKGQTHKSDPTTLKGWGRDGYFDACDDLGIFDQKA